MIDFILLVSPLIVSLSPTIHCAFNTVPDPVTVALSAVTETVPFISEEIVLKGDLFWRVAVVALTSAESDELEDEGRRSAFLPSGIVYLLVRANLTSEALESGFVTEMCSYPKSGEEWVCFERIVLGSIHPPFGPTIARYAVEDGEDSVEMVQLMCGESLPMKLWLRVVELDPSTMAW